MKLLTKLQKQVEAMGALRYAWFTSFNADLEFIETYVLPAVLGAERPRKRLDYEQLQQELTQKDIDFRIFCDPRFLETSRIKRTCIPVHGVRPRLRSDRFSEASLFHPKVIYLEDHDGRRVIGAGSANLTISGWGRNVEVFHFFEVTTYINYSAIRQFFENLYLSTGNECPLKTKPRFDGKFEKWRFIHSYQHDFLEEFFGAKAETDIAVWSPYLPRDLAGFVSKMQAVAGNPALRVHLVPDLIHGKYLRTLWSKDLQRLVTGDQLRFYDSPVERDPRTEIFHAKLWIASGKLAIGSWNFTGPGSNSLRDDNEEWNYDNNIEAGFIIEGRIDWHKACGKQLNLGRSDCASPALLEEEGLGPGRDLPPFDLQVSFDWHAKAYRFYGRWLSEKIYDGYFVQLPGVKSTVPLVWKKNREPLQPDVSEIDDTALLRDRVFIIRLDGKEVFRALIFETNARSRRAQSFETLQDLLEALIQEDDPRSLTDLPFRIRLDTDSFPDDDPSVFSDPDLYSDHRIPEERDISYFRLFTSIRALQAKLDQATTLEALERLVFTLPGCTLELVEKTRQALQEPGRDVFKWFLANEVRALCAFARTRSNALKLNAKKKSDYEAVPRSRWAELEIPQPNGSRRVSPSYYALVRSQSGYE